MELFDCTLRDGGNVLGNGFPADLTVLMLEGLVDCGVRYIEYGNANGIGAGEEQGKVAPLTDAEYMGLAKPLVGKARLGMFILAGNATEARVAAAAEAGLSFLRVGANAGDADKARQAVELVKKHKLEACYSLMKAYVLSPDALADEAARLQDMGVDMVTIMDSAGTMMPDEVSSYVNRMVRRVSIPVGFHGHNNLGMSVPNAVAAFREGAAIIDCGLMGMARSAGNLATEIAVAVFDRLGVRTADLNVLLRFIDEKLAPAMEKHNYRASVVPLDLVFGLAGCHSSNTAALREASKEYGVDIFRLTMAVSAENRKNPSKDLIKQHAHKLAAARCL